MRVYGMNDQDVLTYSYRQPVSDLKKPKQGLLEKPGCSVAEDKIANGGEWNLLKTSCLEREV